MGIQDCNALISGNCSNDAQKMYKLLIKMEKE